MRKPQRTRPAMARAITAIGGALTLALTGLPAAAADPTGGPRAQQWQETYDAPGQYPGVAIEAGVPIVMSDGVTLKADVYRPAGADGRPTADPTPVIVTATPYTKSVSRGAFDATGSGQGAGRLELPSTGDSDPEFPDPLDELGLTATSGANGNFSANPVLTRHGYTQVVVDVRGTGTSAGVWDVLGEREQRDYVEIIDWAATLPGSTGEVGTKGVSYSAINQLQVAGARPPALEAVFAVEPGVDLLRDVVAPGGALGAGFIPLWLTTVNALKWIPDVEGILSGTSAPGWLEGRASSPFTMGPEFLATLQARTNAELAGIDVANDSEFYSTRSADLAAIEAPTFVYGGWQDIFANSETRLYNELTLPPGQKQVLIADGYHATIGPGMGEPGGPPRLDVLELAWFDRWIKGERNGIEEFGPITLDQHGGDWVTRTEFPAPGVDHRRHFLDGAPSGVAPGSGHDGRLSGEPGAPATLTARPTLDGFCSRDAARGTAGLAVLAGPQCTRDERNRERSGLTFTGEPVTEPTEISGPIAVRLEVDHDAADGLWAVSVSDVAPDGRSTSLTSGQVVTSLRAVDEERSARRADGVYTDPRLTLRNDLAEPVAPGERLALDLATLPTSAVLRPGHRLRVSVYAGNLPKSLAIGPGLHDGGAIAAQRLHLDAETPSWVVVPYVR